MNNYATQFNANPCKAQKDKSKRAFKQSSMGDIYLASYSGNTLPKMGGNLFLRKNENFHQTFEIMSQFGKNLPKKSYVSPHM